MPKQYGMARTMAIDRKGHNLAQAFHEQIEIGDRVSWWLRLHYRTSAAKRIARDFHISERQAKRWLSGERPTSEHLGRMARFFGWRFVHFVFEGQIGVPPTEEIHGKLDRLDAQISELRNHLRHGNEA